MKIIKDTRETKGYDFAFYDVEVIRKKLDCGDYKLVDSDEVIFERKANTGELYMNLATDAERERLYREFELLVEFRRPIFLLEFPESYLYDFPHNSHIPKSKWHKLKVPEWLLRQHLYNLLRDFPKVKCVFCDNKAAAEEYIINTFEEIKNGRKKKFDF